MKNIYSKKNEEYIY